VRPDRFPGLPRRKSTTGSAQPRFGDTFARRPGLPRLTRLPNRRAWSTTAVLAALVAGGILIVPLFGRIGSDQPQVASAAQMPVTPQKTAGPTPQQGALPSPRSTVGGRPVGAQTQGPGTALFPRQGGTVIGPPSTVSGPVAPGGQRPPGGTTSGSGTGRATGTTSGNHAGTTTGATTAAKPPRHVQPAAPRTTSTQPRPPQTSTTTAPTTSKPPTVQSAPRTVGVAVQNYGSNRCIDVMDAQSGVGRDGTPLQLWDCAGSSNQKWVFASDGSVRSLGLCMDLALASTADNTQIQLVNCNGGWAQKFTLNAAHDLVNPTADKCVTANGSGNGSRLVLRSCAGTTNQKWHKA
jgi:ricin-type beta-trefoil lectin protein